MSRRRADKQPRHPIRLRVALRALTLVKHCFRLCTHVVVARLRRRVDKGWHAAALGARKGLRLLGGDRPDGGDEGGDRFCALGDA